MKGVVRRTGLVGLIALIGLALALPQAGAIVGGTHDNDNHPNVGIVYLPDRPWFSGFCSGSLLSEHEFLTAGHCTAAFTAEGRTPDRLFVSFDEQVALTPEFVIFPAHPLAVTGWITHPEYSLHHNDVGVIHLAQEVRGRQADRATTARIPRPEGSLGRADRPFLRGRRLRDQRYRSLVYESAGEPHLGSAS